MKRTMKKLTFILMMTLCLAFTACHNIKNSTTEVNNIIYRVDKVKVDNHDYIVAQSASSGISIIHSESCECKKKK